MIRVQFSNRERYEFAAEFFSRRADPRLAAHLFPDELVIEVDNSILGRLLERAAANSTVMLPYRRQNRDAWIIAGTNRYDLERTIVRASRFIVPSYAEFSPTHSTPTLKPFKAEQNRLQQLGSNLYNAGYYSLQSPLQFFDRILERLNLWMDLELQQPELAAERQPTYRELYDHFNSALSGANWPEAERYLEEIQRLGLSSADNLAFLQVQLLAQQYRWSAIWQRPDYGDLARLRIPRVVRAALLTAFHQSMLLQLEQNGQFTEALSAFRAHRARLGLLLTGRFGLCDEPVVMVFGYQALLDENPAELQALQQLDLSQEFRQHLTCLAQMLPSGSSVPQPPLEPAHRAWQALNVAHLDEAIQAASKVDDAEQRAVLFLQIAFQSADLQIAEHALLTYWDLPKDKQAELQQVNPRIPHFLSFSEQLVSEAEVPASKEADVSTVRDWIDWLELASHEPDNTTLTAALDRLAANTDERAWTTARVTTLNELLLQFITSPDMIGRPYACPLLRHLINTFLQDQSFPRDSTPYADLYETLYTGLLEQREINLTNSMTLLRLAEAQLRWLPARRDPLWRHLSDWFRDPIPALESVTLEAFDLLAEYGLSGAPLVQWYRTWVEHLLELPQSRDRTNIESWLVFGEWIQPGTDLIDRLERTLVATVNDERGNHIAELPGGYRIGIFSLRRSSAERVRQMLLARNADLDIRICEETDLNERARAIAENSDLAVVVISCMSHALTYGIAPYLRDEPVYPQSSGSTSIMRAIEDRLRLQSGADS